MVLSKIRPNWWLLIIGLLIAGVLLFSFRYTLLNSYISLKFQQTKFIPTWELESWLVYANREQPIVFDARTPQEYQVSHLPHAVLGGSLEDVHQRLSGMRSTHPIVVYCSEGLRAAKLSQRIRNLGYQNIYLLDGSIYRWANEGRPLWRDDSRVKIVKVYNFLGHLLLNWTYHS